MAFSKNERIQKYSEIVEREGHKIFKLWASGIRSKQIVSIANKIIQDKGLKNNFNVRLKALAFAFALNLRVENRYSNFFKKLFLLFSYLSERAVLRKLNIALGYDQNLQLREVINVEIESLEACLSKRNDWNSAGGVKVSVAYDMTIEQELLLFLERADIKEANDKENLSISESEEYLSERNSVISKDLKDEKEIDFLKEFISFEGAEVANDFNLPQDNANKEGNFNPQKNQANEIGTESAFKNGEAVKGVQSTNGNKDTAKLVAGAGVTATVISSNGGEKQSVSQLPPLKGEGQGGVDFQNQTQTNKNPQVFKKEQSSSTSQQTQKPQSSERVQITEKAQSTDKTQTQSKAQPLVMVQETEVKDSRRIYIEKREAEMEELRRLAHPVFRPEREERGDYKPQTSDNKKQEDVKPKAGDNKAQEVIKPKERVENPEKREPEKISEENLARRELNNSMSKEQIHALAEQIKEQANIVMEREEKVWRERIVVNENVQAQQSVASQPPQVQQGGVEIQNNRK